MRTSGTDEPNPNSNSNLNSNANANSPKKAGETASSPLKSKRLKNVLTWARGRQLLLGVSQSPHTLKVTFRRSPSSGPGPSPSPGASPSSGASASAAAGASAGTIALVDGDMDSPETESDLGILTPQGRVLDLVGTVLLTGD